MNKYRLVAKKGEGTFSEVLKAQCIKNGKYVAIKCMKNHFDSLDQVNNLREIQALRRLSPHPHIIKLLEVLYDQPTGRLALVFELMDMNIYELIRGRRHYVAEERVRAYMYQLMKALDHMHRNGIFHRDIKPENLLIMDDVLKLADFGSCRGIYSKQPYTEYISTRWYRAPECLLTDGFYNYKMDMWGVGCVMFEIVALYPLFPGNNELDQIQKIHAIIGTPPADLLAKLKKRSTHTTSFEFPTCEGSGLAKMLSHVPPDCADLIAKLLAYNPDERLSARQALRHPYFRERREADKRAKAAMQPDLMGSACLSAMDSEYSTQQQQPQHNTAATGLGGVAAGASALRRTDSTEDSSETGAAGGGGDVQDAAAGCVGVGGASSSMRHAAGANGAANTAAAAAGVAGVLSEHLAAVAAAAAAAVAAAAAAGGGAGSGKDGGTSSSAAYAPALPAINSTVKHHQQQQQQQHPQPQQQQQQQQQPLPAQLHMQPQHRQRQPQHPAHPHNNGSSHHSQHHQQQHATHTSASQQPPPGRQQQQQLEGLQGHQLFAGMLGGVGGSNSLKDRDGSIMQLLSEGAGGGGLGLQASMGSLWQESSSATVGGMGGQQGASGGAALGTSQMLPPLVAKGSGGGAGGGSGGGAAQHSARRRSHLGHQGGGGAAGGPQYAQPQHHSIKQQQQQHHYASQPGAGGSSSMKAAAAASSSGHVHLASKAGMLQEQRGSGHHSGGMQISSARYHKQGSSGRSNNNMLQPAGSLASSMSNLHSMHSSVRLGRASGSGATLSAAGSSGSGAGSPHRKGGGHYVSPYGQQQLQQQQQRR